MRYFRLFAIILAVMLVLLLSVHALAALDSPDAACTWSGANANWSDTTQWSCGHAPGATDSAAIHNGTVTLDGDVTVQDMALDGGTLTGSNSINITGSLTWTGTSTMAGSGTTTVASGATATISAVYNNPGDWPVLDTRTLTIAGTGILNSNPAFSGVPHWMVMNNGGVINVTGSLDFQDDANIRYNSGSPSTVNISGTLKKTAGSGVSNINGVAVNNTGSVLGQSGTLSLNGGGTSTGSFSASSGATLAFGGGTHNITLATGKSFSVTGTLSFSGGTTSVSSGGGSYAVSGTTAVNGGVFNLNMDGSTGTLSITNGTLGGSGNLTVTGSMSWTGMSTMAGSGTTTVASGATATISAVYNNPGDWPVLDTRTLTIAGTGILNSNPAFSGVPHWMVMNNGSVINVTGSLDFQDDANIRHNSGSLSTVNNSGMLKKTAGAGISSFYNIALVNTGTVQAQSGTLSFSNFTQNSGATKLNGGSLAAPDNPLNFYGGSLQGVGTVNGNVANLGGTVSPGSSPGILHIAGNYTQGSTGSLNIEVGGTVSGTQYDVLDITGAATLSGTLNISLINSYIPITGTIFTIANFNTRSGDFITETGTIIGGWLYLTPTFTTNHLSLIASKAVADLSVNLTDGKTYAVAGDPITYTLTVANAGPDIATGVLVTDTYPTSLTGVGWSCVAVGGSCGGSSESISSPSGSSYLSAQVNINPGGHITFTIHGQLSASAIGTLINTAYVSNPADPNPANNSATDSDVVLFVKVYLPLIKK